VAEVSLPNHSDDCQHLGVSLGKVSEANVSERQIFPCRPAFTNPRSLNASTLRRLYGPIDVAHRTEMNFKGIHVLQSSVCGSHRAALKIEKCRRVSQESTNMQVVRHKKIQG